ncbi:hypothetical protein P5673_028043 [Acropora cervicornis]|uniref:Uncharacterized protein n=1 Tax=Acropora cervicornis TaxID=6130 RepID=A0AAD9UVE8_ACRCE|nr:hypothetical protein P5673_028043 [Acropora cervicornis]
MAMGTSWVSDTQTLHKRNWHWEILPVVVELACVLPLVTFPLVYFMKGENSDDQISSGFDAETEATPYLVSLSRVPGFSRPVLKTEKMVNTPSMMKNNSTPIATHISSSAFSPFMKYTRGNVTKGRTRATSTIYGGICKVIKEKR